MAQAPCSLRAAQGRTVALLHCSTDLNQVRHQGNISFFPTCPTIHTAVHIWINDSST